jgi:hypothetical protein
MPNAQQYVYGPPTVTNGVVSVEARLQQPLRLTREITDYVALSNYFMPKVFRNAPTATGGAVVYYPLEANDLYGDLSRDVQPVAPGSEFPIVNATVKDPLVEKVSKYGGKFFFPDEAVRRNDAGLLRREEQQLANKMASRLETVGIAKLNQAADSREFPVPTWKSVNKDTTPDDAEPYAGFALVAAAQENEELGVTLNTLIVNPTDYARLRIVYQQELPAMLSDVGITEVVRTTRQTAGTALMTAGQDAGFVAWEKAPSTETWRDPAEQVTWVQHDALPAIVVDNPYAVRRLAGIAA